MAAGPRTIPRVARWVGNAAALCFQIGCNFVNDVADFERGADQDRVDGDKPQRAVASGRISPQAMWRAAGLMLGLGVGDRILAGVHGLMDLRPARGPLCGVGVGVHGRSVSHGLLWHRGCGGPLDVWPRGGFGDHLCGRWFVDCCQLGAGVRPRPVGGCVAGHQQSPGPCGRRHGGKEDARGSVWPHICALAVADDADRFGGFERVLGVPTWSPGRCWSAGFGASRVEAVRPRPHRGRALRVVPVDRLGIGAGMITRFAQLSVPMDPPLPVADGLSERQLAFVEVDGCVAEVSPLPGLHQESLSEGSG